MLVLKSAIRTFQVQRAHNRRCTHGTVLSGLSASASRSSALTQLETDELARIKKADRLYCQADDPTKNFPSARSAELKLCDVGDGWACGQAANSFRLGLVAIRTIHEPWPWPARLPGRIGVRLSTTPGCPIPAPFQTKRQKSRCKRLCDATCSYFSGRRGCAAEARGCPQSS
jgi:hypothetical protein